MDGSTCVPLKVYARDMAENAARAAEIIDSMKSKNREAERGLIAAVIAAGGRLEVSQADLIAADRAVLRIERRISDDALILSIHR